MAATTLVTLGAYAVFTFAVTARRTLIRKQQNQAENAAAQVFTDSMLNFETVKYFDGTAHEEKTYDAKLQAYQDAALRTQYSLAMLNFGQNLIFSMGLSASLLLVANEVRVRVGLRLGLG